MVELRDRLTALRANANKFTGIDFIHVADPTDQTELHVYFLTDPTALDDDFLFGDVDDALQPQHIVIHNVTDPAAPNVEVVSIHAGFEQDTLGRWFLRIQVAEPGDFAEYALRIDDPTAGSDPLVGPFSRVDRFFNDVKFSFKAGCPADRDCRDPEPACPPEERVDFPVDYLARDFVSFRNALLDFAAQRYPEFTLPIEADVGVMLAEVMAAIGDEFSYLQDRYAREAFLETANQRRSLRKKARLLDFEIHDGRSASTLLEFVVKSSGTIPAGFDDHPISGHSPTLVWAGTEDGDPIPFEVGTGIRDLNEYEVRREWNASDLEIPPELRGNLIPYIFDKSQVCLPVGATEIFLEGEVLDSAEITSQVPRRVMLLRTEPTDPSIPARRHLVEIVTVTPLVDPLTGETITRITWDPRGALPFQLDLAFLQISLNVLPATAGRTLEERFTCGPDQNLAVPVAAATERQGPLFSGQQNLPGRESRPTIFLFGLPGTEAGGLGFLGPSLRNTVPEVLVDQMTGDQADPWLFQRSMLAANASDEWFTLEDGSWRRVVAYHREGREIVHQDYATGAGFSLRFGDGVFGRVPPRATEFRVRYRLGPGTLANVPGDAINLLEVPGVEAEPVLLNLVFSVSNPVEVTTGIDPETEREIKLLTPEAFRADVLFAVRPEDFSTQAEKLDFIQRAHGTPRWTGSWTTMFVSGDPVGGFTMTPDQIEQLGAWMDCVRQAGRDVVVKDPKTLPLDLKITVCAQPFAYSAQVRDRILDILVGGGGGIGQKPFFHPDNFTFGMPLRRSALEAAVHTVPGVRFVRSIEVRERGLNVSHPLDELILTVDSDQVIRVDNDPTRPNNGSVEIIMEGGA